LGGHPVFHINHWQRYNMIQFVFSPHLWLSAVHSTGDTTNPAIQANITYYRFLYIADVAVNPTNIITCTAHIYRSIVTDSSVYGHSLQWHTRPHLRRTLLVNRGADRDVLRGFKLQSPHVRFFSKCVHTWSSSLVVRRNRLSTSATELFRSPPPATERHVGAVSTPESLIPHAESTVVPAQWRHHFRHYNRSFYFTYCTFNSVRYGSTNQANSAFHPSGVGKWVVIHVITFI